MKPTETKTTNKEYENEKVPDKALKKWTHFLGMYAGEARNLSSVLCSSQQV